MIISLVNFFVSSPLLMLNDDQLKELKKIIEKTNRSFKEILELYFQNFNEEEYLSTCFSLKILIQNFNVQKETEILIIIYLLYSLEEYFINFIEKPEFLSTLSIQNPLINFFTQEVLKKNKLNVSSNISFFFINFKR